MMHLKGAIGKMDSTMLSGLKNVLLKPIGMILSLVYTPLLLDYLGDTKYGLWVTILSIINWVNYFDVGIGNGLRNVLAKELGEEQIEEARKSVSTAYIVLTGMAAVIWILLMIAVITIDWHAVFYTDLNMRPILVISFCFICINFVLALSNTILYAMQLSEKVALRGIIVQVLNIAGILIAQAISTENLVIMAVLFGASTMIVYVMNSVMIFRKRKDISPSLKCFSKNKIPLICNIGIKFFVIQIMCLMLFTVDDLIITHFFGAEAVTPFSIVNKVYNTGFTVFAAFIVPYWSRSTIAFTNKDSVWLIKCIKRVFSVCALFIAMCFLVLAIMRPLITLWLRKNIEIEVGLPEIMCIFYSLYAIMSAECQFINGSGRVNVQLIIYCIIGVLNIPLSIFLSMACGLGVVGVRLATTILVAIEVVVLGFNLKHIVKTI